MAESEAIVRLFQGEQIRRDLLTPDTWIILEKYVSWRDGFWKPWNSETTKWEDTVPYWEKTFRTLRRIEDDTARYKKEMQKSKADMKAGYRQQTKIHNNQTMSNLMRQKTKGEDWATARKKLIDQALKRKPNFIREPSKKKRY